MKVEVKNFSLQELIKLIENGDLQLPEFQRDYVWKQSDQKALLESIFNGYPVGSLLLLELDDKKPMFAWSMLKNLTITDQKKVYEKGKKKQAPTYLILDGQQRLTTLGQIILNAENTKSFFIKTDVVFKKWLEKGKIKKPNEIINWMEEELDFSEIVSIGNYDQNPIGRFRQKNRWITLSILNNEDEFQTEKNTIIGDVYTEINKISNRILAEKKTLPKEKIEELQNKKKDLEDWRDFFTSVFHVLFTNFFSYSVPSVLVPKEMSVQGVCKIFTSTNTSGIKLGAFDLCIATLFPQEIYLKTLFDEAMSRYPLINAVDGNEKRYVLQYIALSNKLNPKTASLPKTIKAEHFGQNDKNWNAHLVEMNDAIVCLNKYCGSSLDSGDDLCLTYSPIIPTISIILKSFPINDSIKIPIKSLRIQKLKSWYFSSAISTRYGEGSDNKQERDVADALPNDHSMIEWFRSDNYDSDMPNWINDPKYQDLNTSGNGAVAKSMLSILCLKQAKDFWEEDYVVGHSNKDDIHHIFPRAALKRQIMKERKVLEPKAKEIMDKEYKVDSKLNMTFLRASTNREQIKDLDPKVYFQQLLDSKTSIPEKNKFKANLLLHLIDENCLSALLSNDFKKFIEARKVLFKNEFESLGVKGFSDNASDNNDTE
jgi:hypothetical protein